MEWLVLLMLQVLVPADALMQVTLNKSLAQVIQEQISCRKEFDEARPEFERVTPIDDRATTLRGEAVSVKLYCWRSCS